MPATSTDGPAGTWGERAQWALGNFLMRLGVWAVGAGCELLPPISPLSEWEPGDIDRCLRCIACRRAARETTND